MMLEHMGLYWNKLQFSIWMIVFSSSTAKQKCFKLSLVSIEIKIEYQISCDSFCCNIKNLFIPYIESLILNIEFSTVDVRWDVNACCPAIWNQTHSMCILYLPGANSRVQMHALCKGCPSICLFESCE